MAKHVERSFPVGCHVSIAGGVFNAPGNAAALGCETFQVFSRSPQGGPAPELTPEVLERFAAAMREHGFGTFVIHCPYYINFGSEKRRTYHGSVSVVRQELERGSLLGASYVMFHPGSGNGLGRKAAVAQAREGLLEVLDGYSGTTQLLVEIAAGAGEVLGDRFEEVAELMDPVKGHPGFGGVCFDSQHAYASGYDLRTPAAVAETFGKFDRTVGLKWLKVSHINDSKVPLGSRKDRHEHIGDGEIGEAGFSALVAFWRAKGLELPLILETEHGKVEADIKSLKRLRDKSQK